MKNYFLLLLMILFSFGCKSAKDAHVVLAKTFTPAEIQELESLTKFTESFVFGDSCSSAKLCYEDLIKSDSIYSVFLRIPEKDMLEYLGSQDSSLFKSVYHIHKYTITHQRDYPELIGKERIIIVPNVDGKYMTFLKELSRVYPVFSNISEATYTSGDFMAGWYLRNACAKVDPDTEIATIYWDFGRQDLRGLLAIHFIAFRLNEYYFQQLLRESKM